MNKERFDRVNTVDYHFDNLYIVGNSFRQDMKNPKVYPKKTLLKYNIK